MSKPVVIIHHDCPDGYCGAICMYKYLIGLECVTDIELIPAQYGDAVPLNLNDKHVAIIDFSYPREMLLYLADITESLVVLDHHKTAQADCEGLSFATFDMDRCGAQLAYDYIITLVKAVKIDEFFEFHKVLDELPRQHYPWLVEYVADRDLWKWEQPKSKELNAYIASHPRTIAVWVGMLEFFSARTNHELYLVPQGEAILRAQEQTVRRASRHAVQTFLPKLDYSVLAVNSCVFQSEIAENLKTQADIICVWFRNNDDKHVHSLRTGNPNIDVSAIAKSYGGGGHRAAAGFTLDQVIV